MASFGNEVRGDGRDLKKEVLAMFLAYNSSLSSQLVQQLPTETLVSLAEGPLQEEFLPPNFPFARPKPSSGGGDILQHGDHVVPKAGTKEVFVMGDEGKRSGSGLVQFEKAVVVRTNSNGSCKPPFRMHTGGNLVCLRRVIDRNNFGDDGNGTEYFEASDLALADDEINPLNFSLLHLAIVIMCHCDVLSVLLQKSNRTVTANLQDALGRRPLVLALEYRHPLQVINLLIAALPQAVQETDASGRLPLFLAIEKGLNFDILDALIGAYPEAAASADPTGRTAAKLASDLRYSRETIDLLSAYSLLSP
jgi:hypothetical protein